jgi:hypothetical protein
MFVPSPRECQRICERKITPEYLYISSRPGGELASESEGLDTLPLVVMLQQEACCSSSLLNEEDYYGGPPFIPDDASTHWTEPHQLYTWWKNNIERKVKYKILQEDAMYCGPEQRRAARARWCAVVLSLAEVIRCSSGLPMQTKSLITAAMNGGNVEAVMKNQPGVTGSPELSHFSHLSGSFSLPSLQYPMNTNLPDVQLQKMNHPMRGEIPKVPVQRYDRGFQYQRLPPKKALDDSVVPPRTLNAPRMLLGNALLNVIPATSNGSFIRPSAEGLAKVTQNQPPHLNPAWKDDTTKEQKKALFKERSDQIKASSMNNSSSQKGYQQAFPLKLYDLVTEQNNDIIGWLPEGNAFKVKHMENFVNIILPAYFKRESFFTIILSLPTHSPSPPLRREFHEFPTTAQPLRLPSDERVREGGLLSPQLHLREEGSGCGDSETPHLRPE